MLLVFAVLMYAVQYSMCGRMDISMCYRTVQLLVLTVICLLPAASLSNLEQNETIFVNVTTNSTTLQFAFHTGFAVVSFVCCSFSVTGSIFLLVTYSLFKDLRTLPSLLLMSLSSAFLVGDLSLLLGSSVPVFQLKAPCIMAAIILHYFFLARFCWTNMISFEMMRTFTAAAKLMPVLSSRSKRTVFAIYSLIGWGTPLVIIIVSVTVNFTSDGLVGYGVEACWISNSRGLLVFFIIPLALSLLFNLLSFIWVITSLCDSSAQNRSSMQNKLNARLYVAVFSVMGFMWIFVLTAIVANGSSWTRYPFVALNSTQVLVVSFSFTCSKKVGRHYHELFHSSNSVAQSSSGGVPGNQPTASTKVSPAT